MGNKQFLNSMYKPQVTTYNDRGKRVELSPDALIYTTIDIDKNESELHILPNPTIDFYIALNPQPFQRIGIDKNLVRKITVPYKDRNKEIAYSLNMSNEYYNSWKNRSNWMFMENLKKNPNVYSVDTDIEDFYKTQMILKYGYVFASSYKKGYADIEVDISEYKEDFAYPDVAPCPIYLITYIDRFLKEVYSFILYDERVKDDIINVVQNPDAFVNQYMDSAILKENFKYQFNVYKNELDLIKGFFDVIHTCKPDFVGFWNMPFDMLTILNRMRRLGCREEDIANICCHPEIPPHFRYVRYIEDPKRIDYDNRKKFNSDEDDDDDEEEENTCNNAVYNSKKRLPPSRLVDWVEIPGYTQFFDQLATFSWLRQRFLLKSYKLDDIGKKYGGIGKLELADLGYNIRDVNIKNFKICLAYNIRDSYVQYAIEERQRDINQMIASAFNTRLSKSFSNSIIIKNYLMLSLYNEGQIMGNASKFDFTENIKGAVVGRPELLEQLGINVMGNPSYVFENVIDLDATSLYPSIIISHNVFKSALFGRIVNIDKPGVGSLGRGEDLFENLQTIDQSIFEVAESYLGLPSIHSVLKGIEKEAHTRVLAKG
jgi:DNA polymerase elongation subunit (family B)